jgi:fucose permease
MNSVPEHHGALSGMLVTATVGGAAVPLLIGGVGDLLGLRSGMFILFGCLFYIGAIGFWAKPLVTNKRFRDKADASSHRGTGGSP